MRFRIIHQTEYRYRQPASESVGELRICPQSDASQQVIERKLEMVPRIELEPYSDAFGNYVEFFSIPFRHNLLKVTASALIETRVIAHPLAPLEVPFAKAQGYFNAKLVELYPFSTGSSLVPLGDLIKPLMQSTPDPEQTLAEHCLQLNHWIFRSFTYTPGVTDVNTPVATIIAQRAGVCQDFAHLMLSILRTQGIPSRYVSGYIEATDPTKPEQQLIGAAASHAWVEVAAPDGSWIGFDPTNNQVVGERHVKIAVGRDYADITPVRGTYKGAQDQKLRVLVSLTRRRAFPKTP
ncbi:MAG: transglutaminase family protein [Verrucomicrobiota bacterium]|nr:transglutaminase family protein [Verrucomicrobiota bacterium]